MGIKEDWSRVKDNEAYGRTIERVYGKRIKLPPQDSRELAQLLAELTAIILQENKDITAVAPKIIKHLEDNYCL